MSVLRALLKVKTLMSKGERYILNNLYIDDYLCWYPPYMSVLVPPYMSVLVPPIHVVSLYTFKTSVSLVLKYTCLCLYTCLCIHC